MNSNPVLDRRNLSVQVWSFSASTLNTPPMRFTDMDDICPHRHKIMEQVCEFFRVEIPTDLEGLDGVRNARQLLDWLAPKVLPARRSIRISEIRSVCCAAVSAVEGEDSVSRNWFVKIGEIAQKTLELLRLDYQIDGATLRGCRTRDALEQWLVGLLAGEGHSITGCTR